MEAPSDLATSSAIRRVLVRYWIDLGKISLQTSRGLVTISGELTKLPNAEDQLNGFVVSALFTEIQHIPTVRRLNVKLTNWTEVDEAWQPASLSPEAALPSGGVSPSGA